MEYYAHQVSENDRQTLLDHLNGTAECAAQFAVAEMADYAFSAGMCHDIGKYASVFQEKLSGKHNGYRHAAPGAIEIMQLAQNPMQTMLACMLAYCIAGHHTGLPDGGTKNDLPEEDTLCAALNRSAEYTSGNDYSAYRNELAPVLPNPASLMRLVRGNGSTAEFVERFAFLTRYLYSCLTDADFLDTEQYYSPDTDRSTHADFAAAAEAVSKRLAGFQAETPLQKARAVIQAQAFRAAENACGINILNMPTGSGKTLCSLQIAMQKIKASEGRLKRIIYVIQFTSIIEQTAAEFEKLIGGYVTVLQHHSNFSYEDVPDSDTAKKLRLAAENWDAPVTVTTAVQFFESLYHYKSSRLRKLHHLADAVIVLDEIHMLPVKLLQPCLRALGYITEMLHSEILLLSATMPDLAKQIHRFVPDCPVHELITDRTAFSFFAKCSYHDLRQRNLDLGKLCRIDKHFKNRVLYANAVPFTQLCNLAESFCAFRLRKIDIICYNHHQCNDMFQFTPSRGGRREHVGVLCLQCGFNSRPRAEGDEEEIFAGDLIIVSIHALARRATAISHVPETSA